MPASAVPAPLTPPLPRRDVYESYNRVDEDKAKVAWGKAFDASLNVCSHGVNCKHGSGCQIGKRVQKHTVLAGDVLGNWTAIEDTYRGASELSKIKIVRANSTEDGSGALGLEIRQSVVDEVMDALIL